MNRTATALIALATVGGIAAASAAVLGVSADATALPVEQAAVEVAGTQANLFGTSILLPENVAAFYLENGQLTSVGNTDEISDDTLATITAQLTAAPAQSVLYVDTASADEDGLTTALATVTPTSGMLIGSTNEAMQQWLTSLFPTVAGTVASQGIANVPNASFTYSQAQGELTWQITEYVFQYSDATVSVHLSTTDNTGATQAQYDQMLATMVRCNSTLDLHRTAT